MVYVVSVGSICQSNSNQTATPETTRQVPDMVNTEADVGPFEFSAANVKCRLRYSPVIRCGERPREYRTRISS